jgi:HNH endonuclease
VSEIDLGKFLADTLADVPMRQPYRGRPSVGLEERFGNCLSVPGALPTPCRIYQGNHNPDGYGQFSHEGKTTTAHVALWSHLIGDVPKGKVLTHRCLHRDCLEISHLKLETLSEKRKRTR